MPLPLIITYRRIKFKTSHLLMVLLCVVLISTGTIAFAQNNGTSSNPNPSNGFTFAEQATQNLDPSGATIPSTNYPIPSGATFMSPNGNDSNSGKTVNSPVQTINRAVSLTPEGGTIVMRGGDYRDWHSNSSKSDISIVNKGLTIQAYPGESPWFNGADIVNSGWTTNGQNGFVHDWSTPSFCGGKYYDYSRPPYTPQGVDPQTRKVLDTSVTMTTCMYEDAANDPSYPMAGDPQQAFIDGVAQQEVSSLSQLKPGTFFYDWYARKLHLGTNPTGKNVELSARPMAFVLSGSPTAEHIIKGIGFRRYATNGGEGTLTGGAVYFARKSSIENSVFAQNATGGLVFSNPIPGTAVKNSVIAFNGGTGMGANGASRKPGVRNDFVVEGNIFNNNNAENGGLWCNRACGPANIKMAHMVGFVFRNNIIENTLNRAPGVWCDLDCSEGHYVNNLVRNNDGPGIFHEVSNTAIIAGNVIVNNGGAGILLAAANSKIYNNTIVTKHVAVGSRVEAIRIYDDSRTPPSPDAVWPWHSPDVGPNTSNNELANNLIVGPTVAKGPRMIFAGDSRSEPTNTRSTQYFSLFDYNAFYTLENQNLYMYKTTDSLKSPTELQNLDPSSTNFERHAITQTVTATSGSPFVDVLNGDYRLKNDTAAATNKGRPIPSDVAEAMHIAPGSVIARGAVLNSQSAPQPTTTKPVVTTTPTTTLAPSTTKPTTTTTTRPATTTTKPVTTTTTRPATTTTKPVTTTTTRPATTTTTRPPIPVESNVDVAIRKIISDNGLEKLKVYNSSPTGLHARAYFPRSSFFYVAADFHASITSDGNYTITSVDWKISFTPFN